MIRAPFFVVEEPIYFDAFDGSGVAGQMATEFDATVITVIAAIEQGYYCVLPAIAEMQPLHCSPVFVDKLSRKYL